ncbi:hypothetical protein JCM16303_002146 [Sporobolomyces ruberrimus]
MEDHSRVLTPRQLPTPADSPIAFRTDAASFRLPHSPMIRPTATIPVDSSSAATTREYHSTLRSELLGPEFLPTTPEVRREAQQRPSRKKFHRQQTAKEPSPSATRHASPRIFSFSGSTPPSPATSHSSSTDSPLSQAYRLSPFNPTTERSLSSPAKLPRKICLTPCRVLDAPNLGDNFYETRLDWSNSNHLLAVALGSQVFTWKSDGQVARVVHAEDSWRSPKVTSVRWIDKSDHLAVGQEDGRVSIYDARTSQQLRQLSSHGGRVGVLATHPQTVTSGSADRLIFHRDLRMRNEVVRVVKGYKAEVTALQWSSEGELASGGNDNSVRVFKGFDDKPFLKLRKAHSAAIKALAWSPHQQGLLATGGGTEDQSLRFWNTKTGSLTREIDTGSQVCQVVWSNTTNEIASSHGYSPQPEYDNCVHVWRYSNSPSYLPPYNPIASLSSGRGRMLHLALSPDSRYIVCGSSDEVLRFWDVFPASPSSPSSDLSLMSNSSRLDVFSSIR